MIKKLLLPILLLATLASCESLKPQYLTTGAYIDYAKIFSQSHVWITEASSVSFDYLPVCSFEVVQYSGYGVSTRVSTPAPKDKAMLDDIYGTVLTKEEKLGKTFVYATFQSAMEEAANYVDGLGANAIINLKYESTYLKNPKNDALVYAVVIKGMAVKK